MLARPIKLTLHLSFFSLWINLFGLSLQTLFSLGSVVLSVQLSYSGLFYQLWGERQGNHFLLQV